MSLQKTTARLQEVYELYRGNIALQNKLYEFIDKELPERMNLFLQRECRREQLEADSQQYINDFLQRPDTYYFYIPLTNTFVVYDGETNKPISENVILHKILTGISKNNKGIAPWKYKIKNTLMKRIKEQTIFQLIPESYTIQHVLAQFTSTLFRTKEEAKYFLTVLGDNILKKKTKLVHLVDMRSKDFISALQEYLHPFFRNSYHIDTTFKYKYHEHDYAQCRIITFFFAATTPTYWSTFLKPCILDIMSVAVHYSSRYGCADNYLMANILDMEVYNNIFYLKDRTETMIVDDFLKEFVVNVQEHSNLVIKWRELYYLWKSFLKKRHLPPIMFTKQLKAIVGQKLKHDTETDTYIHVTSPALSYISNLQRFWRDTVVTGETDEFEISELYNLYDRWLKSEDLKRDKIMSETVMLSILQHFYDITTRGDKYVLNIKCILWDKQEDMKLVLNELKIIYKFSPELYERTIQSIYPDYCTNASKILTHNNIVSKQYFAEYIHQVIPKKYITENKISNDYWLS